MKTDTLEILRCPYCGGRLELVESLFHRRTAGEIQDGILGCQCCIFPVVDGAHDEPTADLLTQRMQVHEKTAWMLRSLLTEQSS